MKLTNCLILSAITILCASSPLYGEEMTDTIKVIEKSSTTRLERKGKLLRLVTQLPEKGYYLYETTIDSSSSGTAPFILEGNMQLSMEGDSLLRSHEPLKVVLSESESEVSIHMASLQDSTQYALVRIPFPDDATISTSQRQADVIETIGEIFGYRSKNKKRKSPWSFTIEGLCFGLNNAGGQPVPENLQWGKSWEISWLQCAGVTYAPKPKGVSLQFGVGLSWRNFTSNSAESHLAPSPDRGVCYMPYAEGVTGKKSNLKIFSVTFPILASYKIPKTAVGFKAGAILNLNPHASVKSTAFCEEYDKIEWSTSEIAPRRFTVDIFGSVSIAGAVGVYVKWSPMRMMHSSSPINFQPLTLGMTFGI